MIIYFCYIVLLFAGLYDLKTSEVLSEVPALMISGGLFYWYMSALSSGDLSVLIGSVVCGILYLVLGLALQYMNVWADGDAWLLAGVGFMLPEYTGFIFALAFSGVIYSAVFRMVYGPEPVRFALAFPLALSMYI